MVWTNTTTHISAKDSSPASSQEAGSNLHPVREMGTLHFFSAVRHGGKEGVKGGRECWQRKRQDQQGDKKVLLQNRETVIHMTGLGQSPVCCKRPLLWGSNICSRWIRSRGPVGFLSQWPVRCCRATAASFTTAFLYDCAVAGCRDVASEGSACQACGGEARKKARRCRGFHALLMEPCKRR